ncbi:M48 family metalloprotease [Natronorubrum sp. DTA7]|uniref:M48 family metalloprotease n=1 Tax=Natronorubrum sp. DTA7 TaxID=3447016 RepID=UPI003F829EA6
MPSPSIRLYVGMVLALLGLVIATIGLLAGVWVVFYGTLVLFGIRPAAHGAFVATTVTLLTIGYLEYTHLETIERLADAHPVDRETAPQLYDVTTRVAAQLDIPVPTIAVSERGAPEALAVGFRPDNVHLVLSLGTVRTLEDDELEAVIAHELAHVKNRDAMVMTVVSLPVVLADGLGSRLERIDEPSSESIVAAVVPFVAPIIGLLAAVVWIVGSAITARLSRVRERAADRTAAEVTGSPATVASALRRLDAEIADTPKRDLREVSGVSSLSILPLEPRKLEKVMLGPEGDIEPSYWWLRTRLHRLQRWLFGTHPPTAERLESLAALEREG